MGDVCYYYLGLGQYCTPGSFFMQGVHISVSQCACAYEVNGSLLVYLCIKTLSV